MLNNILRHSQKIDPIPYINKGTKILCLTAGLKEECIPIENIKIDDIVKTYNSGYKRVIKIGKKEIINDISKIYQSMRILYKNEITKENLIVSGSQCILVDNVSNREIGFHKYYKEPLHRINDKILLLAAASDKFVLLNNRDTYTVYHFVLENDGDKNQKYGVWANNTLVQSISENVYDKYN